jgi:hypothetical protein
MRSTIATVSSATPHRIERQKRAIVMQRNGVDLEFRTRIGGDAENRTVLEPLIVLFAADNA